MKNIKALKKEITNCIFMLSISWKANKAFFFIKIPMLLIGTVSSFLPMIFLRLILNEIELGKDLHRIIGYAALYAAAVLVTALAGHLLGIILDHQTKKTVYKTKEYLGKTVMHLSYSDLEQPRMKDFIQRACTSDTFFEIINNLFSLISSVLTLAGLVAIVVTLQPLILIMIALVVLVRTWVEKRCRSVYEKYRNIFSPIMRRNIYLKRVSTTAEYGKEIRINRLQKWLMDKRNDLFENEYLYQNKFQVRELALVESLVHAAVIAQECVVYLILAYKVVFTGMLIGDFSMYMTGIGNFTGCLQGIVSAMSNLRKNGEFSEDFRYCVEMANETRRAQTNALSDEKFDAVELEFRNVSFKYPNTDRMILKNISLKLRQGETLSLVGVNGAGKTTFVKLICRLYEPTEGEILINGVPVNTIPYEQYCDLLGVVFQDFKIFAFTAAENVALNTEYDESDIERCMAESDILGKVKSLPEGIQTFLSKEFA